MRRRGCDGEGGRFLRELGDPRGGWKRGGGGLAGCSGDGAVGTTGCRVCTRVNGGGYVGKRRVPVEGWPGVEKAEVRLH